MTATYYGSLSAATEYFENRLDNKLWFAAAEAKRIRALVTATRQIDRLNFCNDKTDDTQELEFPRDEETEVPDAIKYACYELAYELLDGRRPDMEQSNLMLNQSAFGLMRAGYNRTSVPEHLANGIVSLTAWQYLKPFLRDASSITLNRLD